MSDEPSPASERPAEDLGEVWEALDALPRAAASVDMAATTLDLAAVTAGRGGAGDTLRHGRRLLGSRQSWPWPALALAGSLVVGVVLGRATAPDPDQLVLESLPLIRHLGLLREAGSVRFLVSLSGRRNQPPLRQPPAPLQDDAREFDAAVIDLENDHAIGTAARSRLEERRTLLAGLATENLDTLALSAAAFEDLPPAKRAELGAVAVALADPAREELRSAARLWHLIVAASDPADRKSIIDLDADERIEWLERRSRWRELMGERRGLPPAGDGGPPRGPGLGPGGGGGGEGRPRWPGPRGEGGQLGPRGEGGPPVPRGEGGPPGPRGEQRPRGELGPRGEGAGSPNGPPPGDRVGSRGDGPRPRPPERRAPPPRQGSDVP